MTHDISEALSISDKILVLSNRPATVKDTIFPNFEGNTPLKRRENEEFGKLFDNIWRQLIYDKTEEKT